MTNEDSHVIFKSVFYIQKFFGVAPFTFFVRNGQVSYKMRLVDKIFGIIQPVTCALLINILTDNLNLINLFTLKKSKIVSILFIVVYDGPLFYTVANNLNYIFNHENNFTFLQSLCVIKNQLQNFRKTADTKNFISKLYIICIIVYSSLIFMSYFLESDGIILFVIKSYTFCSVVATQAYTIILLNEMHHLFKKINEILLTHANNKNFKSEIEINILFNEIKFCLKLHDLLCQLGHEFDRFFSANFLIRYTLSFLLTSSAMFFAISIYKTSEIRNIEQLLIMVLWTIYNILEIFILTYFHTRAKNEVSLYEYLLYYLLRLLIIIFYIYF